MKKTKLFTLLSLLSAAEVVKFNLFLKKQLRKDSHGSRLWQLLYTKYRSSGNWEGFHQFSAVLFQKLFPEGKNSDKASFNNARSKLIQLLQDFLIQKWLQRNDIERERILLEILRKRGSIEEYLRRGELLRSRLKEQQESEIINRFWSFYIEHGLYFQRTGLGMYRDDNFDSLQVELQRLLFKLQVSYALEDRLRHEQLGVKRRYPSLEKVFQRYPELQSHNTKEWEVYAAILRFDQTPSKEHWRSCSNLMLEYRQRLDKGEQSVLLTWLINTGYRLQLEKGYNLRRDLLLLYRYALEENLFLSENLHLHPQHVLNAAVLARATKDVDFLRELQVKYLPLLQEEDRMNVEVLLEAFLAFVEQHYKKALRTLQYVRFSAVSYSLLASELEIRCQVELLLAYKEEQLEEALNRFESYLRRNEEQLPEAIYLANRNFVSACRAILREFLKPERRLQQAAEIPISFEQKQLVARQWLRSKWLSL